MTTRGPAGHTASVERETDKPGADGASADGVAGDSVGVKLIAALLLVVGSLQMVGDVADVPALKGVAAATMIAPAPKVFSAVKGLETYSTRFFVEGERADGTTLSVELTPEVYGRLAGPYNRRNVYGAVLAYGPVLAGDPVLGPAYESVLRAALCGDAPVLVELGVDPAELVGPARVRVEPLPGTDLGELPTVLEAPCP